MQFSGNGRALVDGQWLTATVIVDKNGSAVGEVDEYRACSPGLGQLASSGITLELRCPADATRTVGVRRFALFGLVSTAGPERVEVAIVRSALGSGGADIAGSGLVNPLRSSSPAAEGGVFINMGGFTDGADPVQFCSRSVVAEGETESAGAQPPSIVVEFGALSPYGLELAPGEAMGVKLTNSPAGTVKATIEIEFCEF